MTYQDDILVSLRKNLTSVSGFWFDCVTSIPWSYIDLHFYLVRSARPRCRVAPSAPDVRPVVAAVVRRRRGRCLDDQQQREGDPGREDPPHPAGRADPEARQIRNVRPNLPTTASPGPRLTFPRQLLAQDA
jgi:hypothetical protein